jgi:hypothetical protein
MCQILCPALAMGVNTPHVVIDSFLQRFIIIVSFNKFSVNDHWLFTSFSVFWPKF